MQKHIIVYETQKCTLNYTQRAEKVWLRPICCFLARFVLLGDRKESIIYNNSIRIIGCVAI